MPLPKTAFFISLSTIFFVVVNSPPTSAQEVNWMWHSLFDSGIMVRFPVSPFESIRKTQDGKTVHEASCNLCNGQLDVSRIPADHAWNSESIAKFLLKTHKKHHSDLRLLYLNEMQYKGLPSAEIGYQFTVQGENVYCRVRIVATEMDRIQISLLSSLSDPVEAWIADSFFNSLEVDLPKEEVFSTTK